MLKRDAQKLATDIGFKEEFQPIGCGMFGACCKISPQIATEILASRNKKNRTPKEKSIARYARDMENGRWMTTHEAVAFGEDGTFRDGQNRLNATVRSETTQTMLVILGVDSEAPKYIDQGKPRSAKDAAHFGGVDASRLQLAAIKNAANGLRHVTDSLSNPEQLELQKAWKKEWAFVEEHIAPVRGVTTSAAVVGVILRAARHFWNQPTKMSRIRKFCHILSSGQYGEIDGDIAPFKLREKLMGSEKFFGRQRLVYAMTEYALMRFLEQKSLSKFYPKDEELFPLKKEIHTAPENGEDGNEE